MTNIASAILTAQYCLNIVNDIDAAALNEIRTAYDNLITSLRASPAIRGGDFDRCLSSIANNPESTEAVTAARTLYKLEKYASAESEMKAYELLDNAKRIRDGYYFIAQSEIIVMSNKRKSIIICEDMLKFRNEFINNHKDEFNVIALDKLEYVQPVINYCEKHNCFPDLLLLDLYWPREGDEKNITTGRDDVREAIDNHKKEISRLRNVVFKWLEPCAIAELVRIRKLYQSNKLPILMYTRAGNFTLDDPDVEVIYSNDADFMPKYRPAHVERQRMRYCIEMRLPWWKKPPSDINWRITFLTLGFGLSLILNIIMIIIKG